MMCVINSLLHILISMKNKYLLRQMSDGSTFLHKVTVPTYTAVVPHQPTGHDMTYMAYKTIILYNIYIYIYTVYYLLFRFSHCST
jgi:hypothetical protein